ncbi:hypothetical protein BAUCODRAFT_407089 [Baudoinia panamericana UAMH 10762]|uniref:Palmitoyltransferase n=1 Tax=Baudoinia panamericana (strain UAMH 10762) TaxID=717646 RepID=M2NFX2_BAUPA|nr:uncharacterized protein BAUCODRAFT_407089 [Baudoinia panamericana UAMH 10762]EMC97895.1 hypothetical protein BAUCODRAFT_407089 [Baudoinia panamericana UAMH 10762]
MSRTSFTDFSDLPGTLGRPSPPHSPPRRKHWARRLERACCQTLAYIPLLFVYGLTTWAVWVEVTTSFLDTSLLGGASAPSWWNLLKAGAGAALWALANLSYTIAVFTSPGSTIDERRDASKSSGWRKGRGYDGLPTYADEADGEAQVPDGMTMVTAKSTGKPRYCKKCRTLKPDRAHHCSTCGRCVLKMDHHCPWLATCVGLRNYKPFLLFLIYTSLFCWVCFASSAVWVWSEIVDDVPLQEGMRVVNIILLAVLGGIIGLVLSAFTGWHLYLVFTGQTTIESLEKTRYLAPVRKTLEAQPGQTYVDHDMGVDGERGLTEQLKEIHANALPGILRAEEGEDTSRATTPTPSQLNHHTSSPAQRSLQRSYAAIEEQRERDRYAAYLDELDSEKLPNAFDLGWKRNVRHVFGENPLLWGLPLCNTSGDGWQWELSEKWLHSRDEVAGHRAQRQREDAVWDGQPRSFEPPATRRDFKWTPGQGFVNQAHNAMPLLNGHVRGTGSRSETELQMQSLDRRKTNGDDVDAYDTSSDEDVKQMYSHPQIQGTGNWNDVPDEFLSPKRSGATGQRSHSRGRRKGD